jgi:hypothetical protein
MNSGARSTTSNDQLRRRSDRPVHRDRSEEHALPHRRGSRPAVDEPRNIVRSGPGPAPFGDLRARHRHFKRSSRRVSSAPVRRSGARPLRLDSQMTRHAVRSPDVRLMRYQFVRHSPARAQTTTLSRRYKLPSQNDSSTPPCSRPSRVKLLRAGLAAALGRRCARRLCELWSGYGVIAGRRRCYSLRSDCQRQEQQNADDCPICWS